MPRCAHSWPLLLVAIAAAGCASADLDVVRPVPIEIRKVFLTLHDDSSDDTSKEEVEEFRTAISDELASAGIDVVSTAGSGVTRVVGTVERFDAGIRAIRYVSGYGLGTGTIATAWRVKDDRSRDIARCRIEGTVSGGVFGGSISEVEAETGRALVRFLGGGVK